MGKNLRKGKVETVFFNLKKLSEKCMEDSEIAVDKEKFIGEFCFRLDCSRRTMLDYINTSISHGKLKIKWKK